MKVVDGDHSPTAEEHSHDTATDNKQTTIPSRTTESPAAIVTVRMIVDGKVGKLSLTS